MPSSEKAEFEEDARKVEEKMARSVKVRKKPVCKLFDTSSLLVEELAFILMELQT